MEYFQSLHTFNLYGRNVWVKKLISDYCNYKTIHFVIPFGAMWNSRSR